MFNKSLDNILSTFTKTLKELQTLSEKNNAAIVANYSKIGKLNAAILEVKDENTQLADEQEKALAIKAKIEQLIGA